jgi:hypothetical protein
MRSNICKIEKGVKDLAAILKESEKVAVYNELNHKQTLQLRLLCEDIDGMLPKIVDDFEGKFWIDFEDGECKVNISIQFAKFTSTKKKELLGLARNKKNASVKGIVAKIGTAIEEFFLNEESINTTGMMSEYDAMTMGMGSCVGPFYYWSLNQYKSAVRKTKKVEDWDELEKSVIASVADDIVVGVKGLQADITIIKKFA